MSDKKDKDEKTEKGILRNTFDSAKDGARGMGNDTMRDLKQIRDEHVAPLLKLGKNRIVAAGMGAKTGFVFGLKGGPKGILVGTFLGAAAGFIGGPKAMEKIENTLGIKSDKDKTLEGANDNKAPEGSAPDNKPDDDPNPPPGSNGPPAP